MSYLVSSEVCKPNEEGQVGCMRVLQVGGFREGNCNALFDMLGESVSE